MPLKPWLRLDWLILLLFAILVILFYWRILTPNPADRQSFPPGDFHAQFWAFTTFEARQLSARHLPLWNPYAFAGSPFWADVQAAVFYPPSLLTLLFSAPWGFSLFALEIEAIAHFWLAALFMYLFIRQLTNSRPAAVVAALTFTFSGYLTGYPSQQLAVLEAVVWLPLILFFLSQVGQPPSADELSTTPYHPAADLSRPLNGASLSLRSTLLAGVAWSMSLLAGHPQSAFIIACVSTAYFLFFWLTPRRLQFSMPPLFGTVSASRLFVPLRLIAPRRYRLMLHGLLFLLTGLGLAAIQFIPAVEYTLLSVRAEGTYEKMSGGFPLTDVIQFLLPGQVSHYSPLYIGVVSLILALWVVFAVPNRHTIFWAIIAFITFLISFGGNTFLYSPLYLTLPGFSIFRGQERWALAVAFSLSVLAGYGFKALLNHISSSKAAEPSHIPQPPSRLTSYLFLFALWLTFLFFFGLNQTGWTPASPFHGLLGAATLLTILLALAWLLWQFAPQLHPAVFTTLTVILICFDLFSANWQTNLYPQPPEWHTQLPAVVAAIQKDAAESPDELYRVYNEFRLYDNYGMPYEIEDLWGASPLRLARYDQFLAPPMPIERTWELLNVKYVITWRKELYVPSTIIYEEPAEQDTTYVHRLATVGPRAWLVFQAEIAEDETILQRIADPTFERWRMALLEPGAEPAIAQMAGRKGEELKRGTSYLSYPTAAGPLSVAYVTHGASAFTLHATTATPALLILSEIDYPGWQARVNSQSAPILRANYVLRAVLVPAGEHTVELTFRPLTFTLGMIVSLITLIAVAIALIFAPEIIKSGTAQSS